MSNTTNPTTPKKRGRPRKHPVDTISSHKPSLVPLREGFAHKRSECFTRFSDHLPKLLELQRDLVPFSTSCEFLGIDSAKVQSWVLRFPAINTEMKRARAEGMIELQRKVAAGTPGWQALMRLAESADPANWIRPSGTGRKSNDVSPYAAAIERRKKGK